MHPSTFFSHRHSPVEKKTMIQATGNSWQWIWPWRNGDICLRGKNNYSLCGLIIKNQEYIWLPNICTPARPGGCHFLWWVHTCDFLSSRVWKCYTRLDALSWHFPPEGFKVRHWPHSAFWLLCGLHYLGNQVGGQEGSGGAGGEPWDCLCVPDWREKRRRGAVFCGPKYILWPPPSTPSQHGTFDQLVKYCPNSVDQGGRAHLLDHTNVLLHIMYRLW